ncbi:hypothetical protein PIB30_080594 [Stylosanthes scabra]|uniref:Uncharacterized protein n=1 Tax=Stylosanthes scabra TaxID=79078 RepID=A0ABU6RRV1_9FABA|nr:hypothetical protein [Stylosanthes scabra]
MTYERCEFFKIASETDAKVTGTSPTIQDPQWDCGKYQKGWYGSLRRRLTTIGSHPPFVYFDPHVDGERDHLLRDREFDPDRPYELPVESLLALRRRDPSKKKDPSPQESGPSRRASLTLQYSYLSPVIRLGSPSSTSKTVPLLKVNKVMKG